uniref:RAD54 like 2 n=1 Tax=Eptatretus burgeri TaxID=7764 RepID=A0A8C4NG30_EPTBU
MPCAPGPLDLLTQEAKGSDVICLDSSESGDEEAPACTKDKDVIELSSGDEAVEVIESDSGGEERADGHERQHMLGSHSNDTFNQADTLGRVLVNISHPPDEPDIFLAPQLARAVKPHQIGGIRFLYDNLVESLERFRSTSGFGCILAHSMGLGKTLQVISFIDALLQHTDARTVLAIVPVNTLQNWLSEFNYWMPSADGLSTNGDHNDIQPRTFKVHILNDDCKSTTARIRVIKTWSTEGGVLLMGYEMYRLLSLRKGLRSGGGRKRKVKKAVDTDVIDLNDEDRHQECLEDVEKALAVPGPDVVICDEGHRIKNCHASTSQALKSVRTRRRVVLTGYPLQNNLVEYWCMVDFVRPNFLGTRHEFSNLFERPILNGQCADSTPQDVRLMRYRSHVLHSLLEGFVQRRGHDVFWDHLPGKQEHVLLVRLSPIQFTLYRNFMLRFKDASAGGWVSTNPIKAYCVCCKIWNHSDILHEAMQKETLVTDPDLDLEVSELGPNLSKERSHNKRKFINRPEGVGAAQQHGNNRYVQNVGLQPFQERGGQVITYEWAKDILAHYQRGVLENSPKMVILFHLIEESVKEGDRILVFSQSLSTLNIIEDFLSKRKVGLPPGHADVETLWSKNHNYFRLDGSTSTSEREKLIRKFNDPTNDAVWLFLLSTRAGCLGINLVGANRVVIFDASWNPCHDAQAVCRIYRYGQRKACFVYRLVSDDTIEKKIYDRQITKQGMSNRVVDDMNPMLNFTKREVENLLHFAEEGARPENVTDRAHLFSDRLLRDTCIKYSHLITKKPFTHESLLMDKREYRLTSAEKRAAKKSYEDEKRASAPYSRPSYAQFYPTVSDSLDNFSYLAQQQHKLHGPYKNKPVANVPPLQSTPVPMMPRQYQGGIVSGFPMGHVQRAGIAVQRVVTTTDIVIPGSQTTTNMQATIPAGEGIYLIQGSRGVYIRTDDGKIFAVRSTGRQGDLAHRPNQSAVSIDKGVANVTNHRSPPGEPADFVRQLPIFSTAHSATRHADRQSEREFAIPNPHRLQLEHVQGDDITKGASAQPGVHQGAAAGHDSTLLRIPQAESGSVPLVLQPPGLPPSSLAQINNCSSSTAVVTTPSASSVPASSTATQASNEAATQAPLNLPPLTSLPSLQPNNFFMGPSAVFPYSSLYGDSRLLYGMPNSLLQPQVPREVASTTSQASTSAACFSPGSHTPLSLPVPTGTQPLSLANSSLAQNLLLREPNLYPGFPLPLQLLQSTLPTGLSDFNSRSSSTFPSLVPSVGRSQNSRVPTEQIIISSDDSD